MVHPWGRLGGSMTMGQAWCLGNGALLPPPWIKGTCLTCKCVNRSGFRNESDAPGLEIATITPN